MKVFCGHTGILKKLLKKKNKVAEKIPYMEKTASTLKKCTSKLSEY
jgi:hypothetical protein